MNTIGNSVRIALLFATGFLMSQSACRKTEEARLSGRPQDTSPSNLDGARKLVEQALSDREAARVDGIIDGRQFAELSRIGELDSVYRLTPNEFIELLASEGITLEHQKDLFNMISLSYCYAKARVDPVGLARDFKNTSSFALAFDLVNGLGRHAPELAIETIKKMPKFDSDDKRLLRKMALRSASDYDMERAIRVFESLNESKIEMEGLATSLIDGLDAEKIGNQGGSQRIKEIVGTFSQSSLSTYPAAISRLASFVAFRPLDEVLEVFPIEGEPWQRMGAMTYLKAFAPVGTPGCEKVGQFLDSDQAVHLTPVERAGLEKLRGGFIPSQQ